MNNQKNIKQEVDSKNNIDEKNLERLKADLNKAKNRKSFLFKRIKNLKYKIEILKNKRKNKEITETEKQELRKYKEEIHDNKLEYAQLAPEVKRLKKRIKKIEKKKN